MTDKSIKDKVVRLEAENRLREQQASMLKEAVRHWKLAAEELRLLMNESHRSLYDSLVVVFESKAETVAVRKELDFKGAVRAYKDAADYCRWRASQYPIEESPDLEAAYRVGNTVV